MIKKIKRPLSIVLVVMMVVSLFTIVPITASAADGTIYDSGNVIVDDLSVGDIIKVGVDSVYITKSVFAFKGYAYDESGNIGYGFLEFYPSQFFATTDEGKLILQDVNSNVKHYPADENFNYANALIVTAKEGSRITLEATTVATTYTVTWKNEDGTILETDTDVAEGATPEFNGATPTKAEDDENTYEFAGWSPEVAAVTGDVTYTATFTAVSKRTPSDDVKDSINALPDVDKLTLADKDAVQAVNDAFNALTVPQVVLLDSNLLSKFYSAMDKIRDLEAAKAVDDMINALPENITLDNKDAVAVARAAYNALTDTQKSMVPNLDKLTAAETKIADLEAAKAVTDKINAIPEDITAADEEQIAAARAAYDALTDDQKALVSEETVNKLTTSEATVKEAVDTEAAEAVMDKIDALPAVNKVTVNDKAAIEAAKAAFDALTDDQKKLVPFADKAKLTAELIALAVAEKNAADEAAADAVEDMIRDLPNADNVTIDDKDAIEAA